MATIEREPDVLDDKHLSEGEEVLADEKIEFAVDGKHYDMDLTTANAQKFRDDLAPWVRVANERRGSGGGTRAPRSSTSRPDRAQTARIRKWAADQKIELNPRGRIPSDVRKLYLDAHPQERAAS